ncbi:MAG: cation transporter [Erysipelotrichaceae bacterium]|nr:cation transporter [Erysipelotrichaceae bacterium]
MNRSQIIVRTSIIGILANVFLASFKAVTGLLTHSIAIVLDAVNNLSDATSSLITIIGTRLAGKEPDRKHPFGHGRIEYLSAMVIAVIVLYAGITSFVESVKKILDPAAPEYTTVSLIIVAAGVLVKVFLGRYVKSVGEKVNSDSLVNSGEDATLDSIISASTLVAALIYLKFGLSLEAWLGAIISVVIIKSGVEMLRETISHLLGEPGDVQLVRDIKATVNSFPEVQGSYDLILHNYGPDTYQGSIHIEVADTLSVDELDQLTRKIFQKVLQENNVALTGIGVYSFNTKDPEAAEVRGKVHQIVLSHQYVKQVHGFYLDRENKAIRFDAVISFDAPSRQETFWQVCEDVQKAFPEYRVEAAMDIDFNEV